jgi:hypothetical protein
VVALGFWASADTGHLGERQAVVSWVGAHQVPLGKRIQSPKMGGPKLSAFPKEAASSSMRALSLSEMLDASSLGSASMSLAGHGLKMN